MRVIVQAEALRRSEGHHYHHFIHELPTIDAVPVVRCKDCKWWNVEWKYNEDGECFCYNMHQWTVPQFYCAVAERRDVNATG